MLEKANRGNYTNERLIKLTKMTLEADKAGKYQACCNRGLCPHFPKEGSGEFISRGHWCSSSRRRRSALGNSISTIK